jgi:arylesterase/paraoxonase
MKKFLIVFAILIISLAGFLLYTFQTTGYFKDIQAENNFGAVYTTIDLPGVEDIALAREDSLLILSVDDRAARRDGKAGLHGIYLVDLREEAFTPLDISANLNFPLYPHGISLYKLDSAKYGLMVINHVEGKHSVESFILEGKKLTHIKKIKGTELISPNDLVMVSPEAFYFTNDHGSTSKWGVLAENYLGIQAANVGYFNGTEFQIVAEKLAYPNGLQLDKDKNLLYVASSRGFLVRVFEVEKNGQLTKIEDIDAGTGVDNIELDENGKLWIGCYPNLLTFAAYAAGKKQISPSEVITVDYQKGQSPIVTSIWKDSGEQLSATSSAVPFGDFLFLGTVMDQKVMVLKKN